MIDDIIKSMQSTQTLQKLVLILENLLKVFDSQNL